MSSRIRLSASLGLLTSLLGSPALAQSHYGSRIHAPTRPHGPVGRLPGGGFGGAIGYLPPWWILPPYPPYVAYPMIMPYQTVFSSPIPPFRPTAVIPVSGVPKDRTRRTDPGYASEMLTIGDRLFRAGNYSRAVDRYEQAIKADPTRAAGRVRIAQVEIVKGHFTAAADRLREAETVEPGWISRASDIQALYLEPADFARQLGKLETHLQSQPKDRDAWLVLGAELFLSGRTRRAADVFLRLSDRREDPTLAAFLDATRPRAHEQIR
jgi:hypothetical protein